MHLLKRGSIWYVCWRDLQGRQHRWSAFPSKSLSHSWGVKLQAVLDCRAAGESPAGELRSFLHQLSRERVEELRRLAIVGEADLASPSLEKLLEQYKRNLVLLDRGPSYVRHQIQRVRSCFTGLHADAIEKLTEADLIDYLRMLRESLSAATVNHYLVALKGFVAWAVHRGFAEVNPVLHVRRLNVAVEGVTRERRAMTDKEIGSLLRFTKRIDKDRYWLYRVALETGLRRGEIRGLKIGNADLVGGWLHVPAAYSRKGGRLRSVPVSRRTCGELRTYWRGRKTSERAFYVPSKTAQWLEWDLKGAGVNPNVRGHVVDFHSLRHTFATRAGRETATFADLMELLGHRTPAMTARYAHAERDRLKAVAERLAQ